MARERRRKGAFLLLGRFCMPSPMQELYMDDTHSSAFNFIEQKSRLRDVKEHSEASTARKWQELGFEPELGQ